MGGVLAVVTVLVSGRVGMTAPVGPTDSPDTTSMADTAIPTARAPAAHSMITALYHGSRLGSGGRRRDFRDRRAVQYCRCHRTGSAQRARFRLSLCPNLLSYRQRLVAMRWVAPGGVDRAFWICCGSWNVPSAAAANHAVPRLICSRRSPSARGDVRGPDNC